jgi:hypothetical protein
MGLRLLGPPTRRSPCPLRLSNPREVTWGGLSVAAREVVRDQKPGLLPIWAEANSYRALGCVSRFPHFVSAAMTATGYPGLAGIRRRRGCPSVRTEQKVHSGCVTEMTVLTTSAGAAPTTLAIPPIPRWDNSPIAHWVAIWALPPAFRMRTVRRPCRVAGDSSTLAGG